jgi:hypothetical protein
MATDPLEVIVKGFKNCYISDEMDGRMRKKSGIFSCKVRQEREL